MQKIVNFAKQYMGVTLVVLGICILLSYSFSSFIVSSDNHRAAEMYIGELKYSMTINGEETNTIRVSDGIVIADINITNLNAVNTYYKLLYNKIPNVEISYYESTKDTDEVVTNYSPTNFSLDSNKSTTVKLKIVSNLNGEDYLTFKVSGGYATNTLADVEVPNGYFEITELETPSDSTYFCKTDDKLTEGLEYINGQYTYRYMQEGISKDGVTNLSWESINENAWGVQLTNKNSTETVNSKICTYIKNRPVISYRNMFSKSKAATINLNDVDISNIRSMSEMFDESETTSIVGYEKFDTSNIIDMSSMFAHTKLSSIDVSNYNTSKVEDMSYIFSNTSATEIKGLKNFKTNNVTNMSGMFASTSISSLDLSSFDTSKVTDMESMFSGSKFSTINLSSFNTSNVTNMDYMFYNCTNLTTIYVGDRFTTRWVSRNNNMFTNTNNLLGGAGTTYNSNNVDYTYAHIDSKDNPGYFSDYRYKVTLCTADTTITDGTKITNGIYEYRYRTSLNGFRVQISDVEDKSPITEISCTFINKIPIVSMSSMFSESTATSIDVSGINTSNVTDMSGMFADTTAREIKGLENFNTKNVTTMSEMFSRSNITTLDLSSFDTSNVTKMNNMFYRASSLTKIYASSKFITDNVTNSRMMFTNATKLVGGNGTAYNASYVDKTYARIDKSGTPGYFTLKSS